MYNETTKAELIKFSQAKPGSTIVDVFPGSGDWTRVFADVVGSTGKVFSFVPSEVTKVAGDQLERMRALSEEPGLGNVEAVSADIVAIASVVSQPVDVLWMHLFYHDLHTPLMQAKGGTAADFNRGVHAVLKPGGHFVIVDHAAVSGKGTDDSGSLHRIDPATVRKEIEAAGFVLDMQSVMLANSDDPHSLKVFDPAIKGKTDRFAYRFVKT